MPKHRWLLLLLVIPVVIWFVGPPAPVRRLPDGSELTLEALTYGGKRLLLSAAPWQRLLAPLIPGMLQTHQRWMSEKPHGERRYPTA